MPAVVSHPDVAKTCCQLKCNTALACNLTMIFQLGRTLTGSRKGEISLCTGLVSEHLPVCDLADRVINDLARQLLHCS